MARGVGHFAKAAEKMMHTNDDVDLLQMSINNEVEAAYQKTDSKNPNYIDVLSGKARRVYDTPDKGILWGWEVTAYVMTKAIAAGAELLCGGKKISDTCYAPTVLLNPPADSKLSTLEVFGPVVCVYGYDDLDAAVRQANALPVAFQAAVFTDDVDTANRMFKQLDASAVMVNDHTAFRDDVMPFAGLRESGLGVGGIPYTLEDMQIEKMMVIRTNS